MDHTLADSALAAFFALSPDPMALLDADGRCLAANAALADLLDLAPGRSVVEALHPDDRERLQANLAHPGPRFETRMATADRVFSWHVAAGAEGVYAFVRDVTPLRRQDVATAAPLGLGSFEALVDNMPDIVTRYDRECRYRFANRTALAVMGLPLEAFLGRTQAELGFPEAVWRPVAEANARVFATGEPQVATVEVRRPGRVTHLEIRLTPELAGGEVVSSLALARDVTARVEAEAERVALDRARIEALEATNVLKEQFLGILSHELRTPLNAIQGFGSILEDGVAGDLTPGQTDYLAKMLGASDHMLALIDDLLDLSRVRAGNFSLDVRAMPLAPAVDAALAELAPGAAAKGLVLVVPEAAELPAVLADPRRVRQIVTNLVGNAIKFTPAGGQVTVSAEPAGPAVRVSVADTGIGIPTEALGRVFEAFTQVDMTPTREAGGVGLGLSIVQALVQAHGGEVGVVSTPGHGATFWFTVPLA